MGNGSKHPSIFLEKQGFGGEVCIRCPIDGDPVLLEWPHNVVEVSPVKEGKLAH